MIGELSVKAAGLLLALMTATLMATGCSSRPPATPVIGRVTLDGKPLEFGGVFFQPSSGFGAGGAIGPDGRFEIQERGGATVGPNKVAVSCFEANSPTFRQPIEGEPVSGKSLVPDKYTSAATSEIEIDVRPGMDEVVIELRSE